MGMAQMKIVGVDPGLKGGIAFIGNDGDSEVIPMASALDFGLFLRQHDPDHVYIEKAHAMPAQGTVSMFSYGKGVGKLLGVIEFLMIPYTEVTPQSWKKMALAGMDKSDKKSSVTRAKQLYPHLSLRASTACRTDSDGMAEALLIAWYGWTHGKGG